MSRRISSGAIPFGNHWASCCSLCIGFTRSCGWPIACWPRYRAGLRRKGAAECGPGNQTSLRQRPHHLQRVPPKDGRHPPRLRRGRRKGQGKPRAALSEAGAVDKYSRGSRLYRHSGLPADQSRREPSGYPRRKRLYPCPSGPAGGYSLNPQGGAYGCGGGRRFF